MYLLLNVFSLILLVLLVLVGVSFLTLFERKSLSYLQNRKGPNKIFYLGILQPFSDGIKLFSKEFFFIFFSYDLFFISMPLMIIGISLLSWGVFPIITNIYEFNFSLLFMFCIMGVNSYPLMVAGWASNSAYSLFGSMRTCAQVISYEVSFIIITLCLVCMYESFNLFDLNKMNYLFIFYMFPVFLMFFVSLIAELNRMPFDFIEGESELVSGFNTEYFGVGFSLIFMGEYCSIMFMSMVTSLFFFSFYVNSLFFIIIYQMVLILIIVIRGAVPRMRYDELMFLCWKIYLPLSLVYLCTVIEFKWLILLIIF